MNKEKSALKKNFTDSTYVVISANLIEICAGVVFFGWLARFGGLELVGYWSFIVVIPSLVAIADFGLTSAFTRKIAIDGVVDTVPYIYKAIIYAVLVVVVVALFFIVAHIFEIVVPTWIPLVLLSGVLLVVSDWLVSIRLGLQEQKWFNVKRASRTLAQFIFAILMLSVWSLSSYLGISLALLLGSVLDLIISYCLINRFINSSCKVHKKLGLGHLISLSRGFAPVNLLQRIQIPAWRIILYTALDAAALGFFSIAYRIPSIIRSVIVEVSRILLPGMSAVGRNGNKREIGVVLAQSILLLLTVSFPLSVFIFTNAHHFLEIWIGTVSEDIVFAIRVFTLVLFFTSLAIPFYWTLQAFGSADIVAICSFVSLLVVIAGGTLLLIVNDVLWFVAIVSLAQVLSSGLLLFWGERKYQLVKLCSTHINLWNVILFITGILAVMILVVLMQGFFKTSVLIGLIFKSLLFVFFALPIMIWFRNTEISKVGIGN